MRHAITSIKQIGIYHLSCAYSFNSVEIAKMEYSNTANMYTFLDDRNMMQAVYVMSLYNTHSSFISGYDTQIFYHCCTLFDQCIPYLSVCHTNDKQCVHSMSCYLTCMYFLYHWLGYHLPLETICSHNTFSASQLFSFGCKSNTIMPVNLPEALLRVL